MCHMLPLDKGGRGGKALRMAGVGAYEMHVDQARSRIRGVLNVSEYKGRGTLGTTHTHTHTYIYIYTHIYIYIHTHTPSEGMQQGPVAKVQPLC
jgi:hypothetical protein